MKVPQTFDMPKVEELQLGKDKLGALNVEGHKAEVQVADTRLDQTNRLAANLDAMLLRAAKTASAPVDVKALEDYLADLRARLTPNQVLVATTRLDATIAHAEKLKAAGRVVSTENWGKRDVQRMVAGGKPQGLPQVGGQDPNETVFAQKVRSSVVGQEVPLFRRDLLAHIAKPGWFED